MKCKTIFLYITFFFLQGKSVNYFVPPPPLEQEKVIRCKTEAQPKIKVSYPGTSLLMFSDRGVSL